MVPGKEKLYSVGEEIANSITHGIGLVLSISALVLLVVFSSIYGDVWHIVSCSIYGTGLVLLYGSSTLYHSIQARKAKAVFKIMDHSSIYFLIAATYTPFTLTILRGPLGWTLFGVVWTGFMIGTLIKVFFAERLKIASLITYLFLGWCVVIAIGPVIKNLEMGGIILLLGGGLAYTLGALVYAKRGVKYSHTIWHLFVLAGSIMHFFSVLFFIIPQG